LILLPPEVDSDRPAAPELLGGHQQQRATSAPEIENLLIASKPKLLEQLGPHDKLAPTRRVKAATGASRNNGRTHKRPHSPRNDAVDEIGDSQQHGDGQEIGGVDSVVPIASHTLPRAVFPQDRSSGHRCGH
jgi:hypothetical protein